MEFVFGACQNRGFLAGLWLKAGKSVQSVVMKPALSFSGNVVDAKTGKPLSNFSMTPGYRWSANDTNWRNELAETFPSEKFTWKTNRMGEQLVFRFELAGYETVEMGPYTSDQSAVIETVRMNPK